MDASLTHHPHHNQHDELHKIQVRLERLYALEPAPPIAQFVEIHDDHDQECLMVHEGDGELRLQLRLPANDNVRPSLSDSYAEHVEGVSHFLLMVERARTELPTTLLELELQAEVDKFALLAFGSDLTEGKRSSRLMAHTVHQWLYEQCQYLHPAHTLEGDRYRAANRLAARWWSKMLTRGNRRSALQQLRTFYRCGPHEKIRLAKAV